MKRIISLLLVAVMLLGLFTACGKQSQTEPEAEESTETTAPIPAEPSTIPTVIREDPDDLEWMEDTSPITFTIFHNNVELADWQWGNDPITQYITERTGVTLDYEFAPDAEDNRLTLMLAGGEELPDFISHVAGDSQIVNEMIKGDYIYAINDLIDQYCPKMYDLMYEEEYTRALDENGKIWTLSSQDYLGTEDLITPYAVNNGFIGVRTDILRDLGFELDSLKTTDDLLAFLKAFDENKDQYPNIKYPILIGPQAIGIGTYCGMFGEAATLGFTYDKETDTIMNWYEREAGKEQLHFLNDLYKMGYIKPEALTVDRADYMGLVGAGTTLMLLKDNVWEAAAANASLAEVEPGAEMSPIGPITVDENTQWKQFVFAGNPTSTLGIAITKDCKNPERAIKFLEFLRTEEANLAIMCGIYGKDYEILDDNGVKYTMPIGDALACGGDYNALSELGIYNWTRTWLATRGIYDQLTTYSARFTEGMEDISAGRDAWLPTLDTGLTQAATGLIEFPTGSELANLYANVKATRETFIAKIVLADTDEEFEEYYNQLIKETKAAGSDRMIEIMLPLLHEQMEIYDPDGTLFQ